jgi:hypothetical protein
VVAAVAAAGAATQRVWQKERERELEGVSLGPANCGWINKVGPGCTIIVAIIRIRTLTASQFVLWLRITARNTPAALL